MTEPTYVQPELTGDETEDLAREIKAKREYEKALAEYNQRKKRPHIMISSSMVKKYPIK